MVLFFLLFLLLLFFLLLLLVLFLFFIGLFWGLLALLRLGWILIWLIYFIFGLFTLWGFFWFRGEEIANLQWFQLSRRHHFSADHRMLMNCIVVITSQFLWKHRYHTLGDIQTDRTRLLCLQLFYQSSKLAQHLDILYNSQ